MKFDKLVRAAGTPSHFLIISVLWALLLYFGWFADLMPARVIATAWLCFAWAVAMFVSVLILVGTDVPPPKKCWRWYRQATNFRWMAIAAFFAWKGSFLLMGVVVTTCMAMAYILHAQKAKASATAN